MHSVVSRNQPANACASGQRKFYCSSMQNASPSISSRNKEQSQQTRVVVTDKAPTENEPEYRGPHIHIETTSQAVQPTAQYLYQGLQSRMPIAHPGAPSVVVPPFAYPGHPMLPMGSNLVRLLILVQCILLKCFLNLLIPKNMLKLHHKLLSFLILKLICKVWLSIRMVLVEVKPSMLNISC